MIYRRFCFVPWLLLLSLAPATAVALDDSSLSGVYFLRQVQFAGGESANVHDARSLIGTATFDGAGGYVFQATLTVGGAQGQEVTGSGTYSVHGNGVVRIVSPLRDSATLNARLGKGLLIGANTGEAGIADILAAVPAPTAPVSNSDFAGSYQVVTLEMPGGVPTLSRSTHFRLDADGLGSLAEITVQGIAANLGGRPLTQTVFGGSYSLMGSGAGSVAFPEGGADPSERLLSGVRVLYLSEGGGVALAGSTTPNHDILLAIRSMPNPVSDADWNGLFWSVGLSWQDAGRGNYAGSANVTGQGKLVWSRRMRSATEGRYFTGVNGYSLGADGTGVLELGQVAIGAGGDAFIGSGVSALNPGAYEISIGIRTEAISGDGVFLHPNGVVNAASFAPAGNPISPGEFLTLFGSGLAPANAVATGLPFPFSLEGVEILIGNRPAPVYAVSPTQLSVLAPHGISSGTAIIVVNNNGEQSNPVEVSVSATAPGIFSSPAGGIGHGAILKADWSVVSASNPVHAGDIVQIYLTGLGAVEPTVADGVAAPPSPLSWVTAELSVYIGGREADVLFQGLAPNLAGLYQLNVRIPAGVPPGNVPLAVSTPDAFHDQVDIAVTP